MTHDMIDRFHLISKYLVIAVLGFFSLFAQTLIFRDFLTVFNGNEISLGIFFFTWLCWVVAGALIGRTLTRRRVLKAFNYLLLLYIPALLMQRCLFIHARSFMDVKSYELIPMLYLIPLVSVANIPVSFLSGLFFVIACKWWDEKNIEISRVYVFEAAGSFFGAILVTVLLFFHVSSENLTFLLAMVLALVLSAYSLAGWLSVSGTKRRLPVVLGLHLLVLLFFLGLLVAGTGDYWEEQINRQQWRNVLLSGTYEGSFNTENSKYHYGRYDGDFVVCSWNSVVESYPSPETAWKNVALNLAQKPDARRILVIGSGITSTCEAFCQLKQVEKVVWLDADRQYPYAVMGCLEKNGVVFPAKLVVPGSDVRSYLRQSFAERFDLIIIDFSEPSTLLMNRYFTLEFFQMTRKALAEKGVLSVAFPGGENYLGTELEFAGASVFYTLHRVFANWVLKPGEHSIFFVSDSKVLTNNPEQMTERLQKIPGLVDRFPPEAVTTFFTGERAETQMEKYSRFINELPQDMLINSDSEPKAFIYCLLFNLKKMEGFQLSFRQLKRVFSKTGVLVLLLIAVYCVFRLLYVCFRHGKALVFFHHRGFFSLLRDEAFLVLPFDMYFITFATSVIGMFFNIILIFMYQIAYGAIFLNFGIISSLFMIGLFGGGALASRLARKVQSASYLLPVFVTFSLAMTFAVMAMPLDAPQPIYALFFFAAGFSSGTYLPYASSLLKLWLVNEESLPMKLEALDHIGGALGALLAGILILPVLGIDNTLIMITLMVLLMLIVSCFVRADRKRRSIERDLPVLRRRRKLAFCFVGVFSYLLLSWVALFSGPTSVAERKKGSDNQMIKDFVGDQQSHIAEKRAKVKRKVVPYFELRDAKGKLMGYVYNSRYFSPSVRGYGGPMELLIHVSNNGIVKNFKILKSKETALFQDRVVKEQAKLLNYNIFNPAGKKMDTISGATVTSRAVIKILEKSGKVFKNDVLKQRRGSNGRKEASLDRAVVAEEEPEEPIRVAPRNIDQAKYKSLVSRGKMSDKNARFYKKIEDAPKSQK